MKKKIYDCDILRNIHRIVTYKLVYGVFIRPSKDGTYYGMALSVCPSTIACERDILKTACPIDFTFVYGLDTTKTSDAIDFGHSTKTKWPPQQFEY